MFISSLARQCFESALMLIKNNNIPQYYLQYSFTLDVKFNDFVYL